ncbi:MAG: DinB family protein [Cytophagales bacterium]|nr:MAG: DinB family protein [Cytophagales bacterium]TAF62338.1 MAG: DinB family protein [Cytophagales bacterium]
MKQLVHQIDELESFISQHKMLKEKISNASVGWHIAHLAMVMKGVPAALKKSKPEDYKPYFNLNKFLVLTFKYIPRGRAKAPNAVTPPTLAFDTEKLKTLLQGARDALKDLDSLPPSANFSHPMFGPINLAQALSFLAIHNAHHIKIIRDIVKK